MTATANQQQVAPAAQPAPSVLRHQAVHVYFMAVAFAACELGGMAAVVKAYSVAQTTLSSTAEFTWFWAGMLLLELPIAAMIARRATQRTMRSALLVLYGLISFAPKLLRNPTAPIYHDEFAHWRAAYEILSTGKLFQPNPIISIIAQYPGLHAATAALVHATGLGIWQAGTLLLILFHVTLVLGIAALATALGFNNRTASLIAIFYCLNSSFLYFDTQYAYESMAVTLVVWALVAYVRTIRSLTNESRIGWGLLTVLISAGTVVTHPLSTFTLVVIMAIITLTVSVPWLAKSEDWARTAGTAWVLTLITTAMAGGWFRFIAPGTWSYLSPYAGQGFSELMQDASGSSSAKQLFVASLSPWWEQWCAYLVTVLAFGLAVGGLFLIRAQVRTGRLPRGRRRAVLVGFVLFGLVYFPSIVFILAPTGSEGARRSWAFTWIGLSMLAGPAAVWLLDQAGRCAHRWTRLSVRSATVVGLSIALVGGTAAGVDAAYRLPGPFLYGSDARSITPELLAASQWFKDRFGSGNNIVTDRYTGLVFGSFGLQNTDAPSAGFPVYDLYLAKPGAPLGPALLISDLTVSDYTYLIVDERMAYDVPEIGVYFSPSDPASVEPKGNRSPFYGRLAKFDSVQWMVKVFQSDDYSIYRLTLPAPQTGYQQQPPKSKPPKSRQKLHKHGKLSSAKLLQGKLSVTP